MNRPKALLNYGFSNYALVTPEPEDGIPPVLVVLGTQEFVTPRAAERRAAPAGKGARSVDPDVRGDGRVGPRAGRGRQQLGRMTVTAGDETVAEIPPRRPGGDPARTFPDLWAELLGKICFSGFPESLRILFAFFPQSEYSR